MNEKGTNILETHVLNEQISAYLGEVEKLKTSNGETSKKFYLAALQIDIANPHFKVSPAEHIKKSANNLLQWSHPDKIAKLALSDELNQKLLTISQVIIEARNYLKDAANLDSYIRELKDNQRDQSAEARYVENQRHRDRYQALNTLSLVISGKIAARIMAIFTLPDGKTNRSHKDLSNIKVIRELATSIATGPRDMFSKKLSEKSITLDLSRYQPDIQVAFIDELRELGGIMIDGSNNQGLLTVNYHI